jgi:uncharacterized protein (DUF2147 family)
VRADTRKLFYAALTLASLAPGLRLSGAQSGSAETEAVRGYWREPSGAVLRIVRCGDRLCIEIASVSAGDHPDVDTHNPDPKLRGRALCGLRIGTGFIEKDAQHAEGGRLYDPKTGRTYRGSMTAQGDQLKLRGFVGIELFGRTEIWTRARQAPIRPADGTCRPRR